MEISQAEIENAMNYVKKVASSMLLSHEFDDLVGEGMIGLTKAMKQYDADKGTTLAEYASKRIKGSMIDYLRKVNRTRRVKKKNIAEVKTLSFYEDIRGSGEGRDMRLVDILGKDGFVESYMNEEAIRDILDDREWVVIKGKYFDNNEHVKEAMKALGVSETRISQLHARALKKLEPLMDYKVTKDSRE